MSDAARVHRNFHRHPKVKACSNGAIGLWTKALSLSRHERQAGFVTSEQATILGAPHEICELVESELWDRVDGGFYYHDYGDWNFDPNTMAEKLVYHVIGEAHPARVLRQLEAQVEALITEGTEVSVLERTLKLWLSKPGAGAPLLPYLVSDALRASGNPVIELLLREAYRSGDMTPLQAYGYIYEAPDPPAGQTVEQVRALTLKAKRDQIMQWQKELK